MSSSKEARDVAVAYIETAGRRDAAGMAAMWRPGGIDQFIGDQDVVAPDGVRQYFEEIFGAFPDFSMEILRATAERGRCAVQYRFTGTFAGPGTFAGMEPTGGRIDLEGCDVIEVEDGQVVGNKAYLNQAAIARHLGALPPAGSKAETRMTGLLNARTRVAGKLGPSGPEPIADGVWIVRGGLPRTMNVFLVRDGDGVLAFDGGVQSMTAGIATAAAGLGGLTRVVLGHAHPDHRGAAPGLGVPVWCHEADRADAEGDGGEHYFHYDRIEPPHARFLMPRMIRYWDGGPVPIAETLAEGDDVAGFRVVHLPGHSPGLIALWRESDRLALATDCFYTLDPLTGRKGHARLPHRAFNQDTEQARASIRKLAALAPAAAWPGHADPLTGDVRGQLERAADTT